MKIYSLFITDWYTQQGILELFHSFQLIAYLPPKTMSLFQYYISDFTPLDIWYQQVIKENLIQTTKH